MFLRLQFFLIGVLSPMCAISSFYSEQVNRGLNYRPQPSCAAAQWRRSVRSINAILWSPSTGLVCHSPEMNWESSETAKSKQMAATSRIFGPVQNEHLVVRTYDRWPLRASGFLGPLAQLAPPPPSEKHPPGQWLMSRPAAYSGENNRPVIWCKYRHWGPMGVACLSLTIPVGTCTTDIIDGGSMLHHELFK